LHIAEHNEKSGKYKTDSEIKYYKARDGDDKLEKSEGKGDTVDDAENKKYRKSQTEVDKR
jgi:hypothetical protein